MKTKKCLGCGKALKNVHPNRKRCKLCAKRLGRRPAGTMTAAQIRTAMSLKNKIPQEEIAKRIGVSPANLKRSMPGVSFWFKNGKYKNNPELTKKVISYYFKHGQPATVKRFPGVNVKCIVDRPEYYGVKRVYRQIQWTEKQIIEAVKMAGLIPFDDQAKYFNRPRAHIGSIRSLWMKRFKLGGGNLNGMCHWTAKNFVSEKAPYIKPIGLSRNGKKVEFRRLILWVDMEKVLKPDAPEFVRQAVKAMADFQRWIWNSDNPKPLIMKMIKERSI